MMYKINQEIKGENLGGGVTRKVLSYSENIMAAELEFEKGAIGALHSHVHEQIGYVVSGSLKLLGGETDIVLHAGDTYYIAPKEEHGVIALEKTKLLDIFTPMRKDFLK